MMKSDRIVIFAVLFLAVGVGVIFAFCQGSTGMSFGYPLSGTKVQIDLTTTGIPALVGVPMVGLGVLLLFIALIAAIVSQFRPREVAVRNDALPKRQVPFENDADYPNEEAGDDQTSVNDRAI